MGSGNPLHRHRMRPDASSQGVRKRPWCFPAAASVCGRGRGMMSLLITRWALYILNPILGGRAHDPLFGKKRSRL